MNLNSEEQVRLRAYELWQLEGCPNARDKAHWYQAERELLQCGDLSLAATDTTSGGSKRRSRISGASKITKSQNSSRKQPPRVSGATQTTVN